MESTKSGIKPGTKSGVKAGTKSNKKSAVKSKKKNSTSTIIECIVGILVVAAIIAMFFLARDFGFTAYANEPMGTNKNNVIDLEVNGGDSVWDVAEILEQEGMIPSKEAFYFRSVFSQYHGLLKEGEYQIDETMGIDDILAVITQTGVK